MLSISSTMQYTDINMSDHLPLCVVIVITTLFCKLIIVKLTFLHIDIYGKHVSTCECLYDCIFNVMILFY